MPGGPLAGFMVVPLALLAGIYLLQSPGWRVCCIVGLTIWVGLAIALPVIHREWANLFFPFLVIAFWLVMSEVKREFKD